MTGYIVQFLLTKYRYNTNLAVVLKRLGIGPEVENAYSATSAYDMCGFRVLTPNV